MKRMGVCRNNKKKKKKKKKRKGPRCPGVINRRAFGSGLVVVVCVCRGPSVDNSPKNVKRKTQQPMRGPVKEQRLVVVVGVVIVWV